MIHYHSRRRVKFKDTKEVIRIRKSKKNRQHNGQKKNYKRTKNDLQNIHIKLKIPSRIYSRYNLCSLWSKNLRFITHSFSKQNYTHCNLRADDSFSPSCAGTHAHCHRRSYDSFSHSSKAQIMLNVIDERTMPSHTH